MEISNQIILSDLNPTFCQALVDAVRELSPNAQIMTEPTSDGWHIIATEENRAWQLNLVLLYWTLINPNWREIVTLFSDHMSQAILEMKRKRVLAGLDQKSE